MEIVIGLVVGLLLGGGVVWLLTQSRARQVEERLKGETATALATAQERMNAATQRIQSLEHELKEAESNLEKYRQAHQAEASRRAAAEEKNTRIPQLDEESKADDASRLQQANSAKAEAISELQTRIEEERKAQRRSWRRGRCPKKYRGVQIALRRCPEEQQPVVSRTGEGEPREVPKRRQERPADATEGH